METDWLSTLTKTIESTSNMMNIVSKSYGLIHKREIVEYNGKKCWLVWDSILYNEITLEEMETGKQMQMWTSKDATETEAKFNEIILTLNQLAEERKQALERERDLEYKKIQERENRNRTLKIISIVIVIIALAVIVGVLYGIIK